MTTFLRDPTRVTKGTVLVLWTLGFVWLLSHGRFLAFLRPSLWPLLASGLLMVLLFLLPCLLTARRGKPVSGPRRAALWMRMGILSLPLLCLVIEPRAVLDSYAFGKRSVSRTGWDGGDTLLGPPGIALPAAQTTMVAASQPSEAVSVLHLIVYADQWRGRRVTTDGAVYREKDVPKGYFVLFRFVITCCAADARPIGVLVKEATGGAFAADSWVHVMGTVAREQVDGVERIVLHPDHITAIEQPAEPYLCPEPLD